MGSIGGSLDISRRGSTVRETSQNAISTLLQPPIVRTGLVPHTQASAAAAGYRAPTTKDIPPVALTNVPTVPQENFREYLTKIGPLFESLQRGRAEPEQAAWLKKDKDLAQTDRFAEALERRVSSARNSTPNSPAISRYGDLSPLSPADTPTKRRSSGQVRRNRNEPTPLSTIPGVYFDDQFHLENPRTFDVVSENAEIVRPPPGTPVVEQRAANGSALPPRKALATNAILQEKLSWYMDTVEVHLINSISTASSGFFAALGSLKELQTEAEESVAKIQSLREDLRRLDQEVAVSGLEVAAKRRRRENVGKLGRATAQVQTVVENVKKADALVDEGSYDAAADQMDRVGRLVCGQAEPGEEDQELIDLRPLKALQGLDSGLQELQLRIGAGFAHRFTTILIDDLRAHVEKVSNGDTLKRWSRQRGIPPTYMETSPQLRADLLAALSGLARAGHTAPATATYREAVNKEMKTLIRKFLPSSSDDDADSMISTSTRGGRGAMSQQEKSSILARNLRALDPEDAEKLLIGVYTSVGEALRRVSTQTKILLDVTSSMDPPAPTSPRAGTPLSNGTTPKITVQEELSQTLDMSSLLGVAVDTAQTQITRILKVRNEQSIRLPVPLFLRYFRLNRLFADECEAVSGRGGNVLKGIINAQISGFVQVLGTSETERIAGILDADLWNAEDFTPEDDVLLQRILCSEKADPPEWTNATIPLWDDATPTANGTAHTSSETTRARSAKISQETYPLPKSAIALLPTITTFLSLTAIFHSSVTPQITTSLLESLKTFNSRSCQLILGAGATRSAGLKNITTKHLALAFQSLAFVLAILPAIRGCVLRHGGSGMTTEFEKFERLVGEHQSGIRDKLVEIMVSRSASHVKAMLLINFDNAAAGGGEGTLSPYMETLTKETLTLHRVLGRYLSDSEVGTIMGRIREGYREQWTKAFREVGLKTIAGKTRLAKDANGFKEKLGKVEGFEGVGREVMDVVQGREIKEAVVSKEVKKPNEKEGEVEVMFEAEEVVEESAKVDEKDGKEDGDEEKK